MSKLQSHGVALIGALRHVPPRLSTII